MIPTTEEILDENGNVTAINRVNEVRTDNPTSTFNPFDSYKSIAKIDKTVLNTDHYHFNERFSDIISEAIILDNRYLLSPEQKKLVDRYFSTAPDSVGYEAIRMEEDEIFTILSDEDLIQLDKYLGEV